MTIGGLDWTHDAFGAVGIGPAGAAGGAAAGAAVATAVVGAVGLLQDQMGVSIASRASMRHMVDVVARCFPVEPDSGCMLSR